MSITSSSSARSRRAASSIRTEGTPCGHDRHHAAEDCIHHRLAIDPGDAGNRGHGVGGAGPLAHAGERVEAFTGPLWLAILTVADLLAPIDLEWMAVLLGIFFSAIGLGFATAGAVQFWRSDDHDDIFFVPAGALVLLGLFPVWLYVTSGMETGLAFGWLGVWRKVWWDNSVLRRFRAGRFVLQLRGRDASVRYLHGVGIDVAADGPRAVQLDGDEFGEAIRVACRVIAGGLVVTVPKGHDTSQL